MRNVLLVSSLAGTLLAAACSPAAPAPAAQAPAAAAPTTAPAASAAPPAPALATNEQTGLQIGGQLLASLNDAVGKSDFTAAKTTLTAFNTNWSGAEVWVKIRNKEIYENIEVVQKDLNREVLDADKPNAAAIKPLLETLKTKWDAAAKEQATGAKKVDPGVDALAIARWGRADLRNVSAALKKNDVPGAKASFDRFTKGWAGAEAAAKKAAPEPTNAVIEQSKAIGAALNAGSPNAADLAKQNDDLIAKLTESINAINAALPADSRY